MRKISFSSQISNDFEVILENSNCFLIYCLYWK